MKHTAEQKQFKNAVFEVAKQASELKVSEVVHEMRRQVMTTSAVCFHSTVDTHDPK